MTEDRDGPLTPWVKLREPLIPDGWREYAYTVGELREQLAGLPDDMPVILEKDAEGNGYSPLSTVYTEGHYHPDSTYSGEITMATDCGLDDWGNPPGEPCSHAGCRHGQGTLVVVLGPVN